MPWFLSEKVTALYVGIATVCLGPIKRMEMAQARVTIPLSRGAGQFKDRTPDYLNICIQETYSPSKVAID